MRTGVALEPVSGVLSVGDRSSALGSMSTGALLCGLVFLVGCVSQGQDFSGTGLDLEKDNSDQSRSCEADRTHAERTKIENSYDSLSPNGLIGIEPRGNQLFLILDEHAVGKDMLFSRDGGVSRVVRWVPSGEYIDLVRPQIHTALGPTLHPAASTFSTTIQRWRPSLIRRFKACTNNRTGAHSLDVTPLFTENVEGIPTKWYNLKADKTRIVGASAFGDGVEIVGEQFFESTSIHSGYRELWNYWDDSTFTIASQWTIQLLPPEVMPPRKIDPRMGFFSGDGNLNHDYRQFSNMGIERWRLEKKDPNAAISEVIRPIVFYLDPSVPSHLKQYVRRGVLSWLPAFESAGFRNALEVREFSELDKEMSLYSARHSFIRVVDKSNLHRQPVPQDMGFGGGTAKRLLDPRSGEILKADILINHPDEIIRDQYFVRCAAVDERAQRLPFPDELTGELYRVLAAHEAGHAFGLRDGHYGEFSYSSENLRDPHWLRSMGFSPSIMNYSRCNYVAQPEDRIDPIDLLPKVGPADFHQIRWAYATTSAAESSGNEKELLKEILAERDRGSWLQYVRMEDSVGPQSHNESAGTSDPVRTTELGLRNLHRILELLPEAVASSESPNALLERLYVRILDQWVNKMVHVVTLIGGFTVEYKAGGQPGAVYSPVSADVQRKAMKFLTEHTFQTPHWLNSTDITRRFETTGAVTNIVSRQEQVLLELLERHRLARLAEQSVIEHTDADDVYTLDEMLFELQHSIWLELNYDGSVSIDGFRQELQSAYLSQLAVLLESEGPDAVGTYERSVLVDRLLALRDKIDKAQRSLTSGSTSGHLYRVRNRLDALLSSF